MAAMRLMLRAGGLPTANGVLATMVLTMTADQWAAQNATEAGLARTGHGATVPVSKAKAMARGEARIFPVVLDATDDTEFDDTETQPLGAPHPLASIFRTARPITAYGTSHRIFVENQRLAMIARDGGCAFPCCTVPPLWCEADHVTDWQATGRTSVDDGHLACPRHHREKGRNGWRVEMINGLPHWIPPAWVDPTRTPRRNRAHDPVVVG